MTDCASTAITYSTSRNLSRMSTSFIFVNEIVKSEKLQILEFNRTGVMKDIENYPFKNSFNKPIDKFSLQATE